MKALILNSGLGHRMGVLTSMHPKCMTEIFITETILSRQLTLLAEYGINEIVMTTGYFDTVLINYCRSLELPLHFNFVKNPLYDQTNYIYSIYCARDFLDDDIILMHGDLVFESSVLDDILAFPGSCMKVSSTIPLPDKDFKAVVCNGIVKKIGIEFFTDAMEAQALYKLNRADWKVWLEQIIKFCEHDQRQCYAEVAFNEISENCSIHALDMKNRLCAEIDTSEDLAVIKAKLNEIKNRTVYMCFATDMIHSGHIAIIRKARKLGKLIIGVLSDDAVSTYRRVPIMPVEERQILFENIAGVKQVIVQQTLSYRDVLQKLQPNYVVHGDDWVSGFQKNIRDEVIQVLAEYGGQLIEYPYSKDSKYSNIENLITANRKPK